MSFEVPNYRRHVDAAIATQAAIGRPVTASAENAFEALNRAAYLLQPVDTRVGLVYKPSGNNVRERSVDCLGILTGDGRMALVDCIKDAGGPKGASAWQVKPEAEWLSADRWRKPDAPSSVVAVPPETEPKPADPEPPPEEPETEVSGSALLGAFSALLAKLDAVKASIDQTRTDVSASLSKGVKIRF